MSGVLYVVPTPIGNLEDITLRALRVLKEVAVVAAEDTRSARFLLDHFQISTRAISNFEGNEAARSEELVARLKSGDDIAIISEAGTPAISDPGHRLVAAAIAAGLTVCVLPGASAAITALVGSGFSSESFRFVGFPPREEGARRELFGSLFGEGATLIFYESPNRTAATLADLALSFGDDRRACVARELTKVHEEFRRGTLRELADHYAIVAPRGEVSLVVEGGVSVPHIDIEAEVRRRIEAGDSPKEISAALSLTTGKPKRQIYQLALALQGRK